MHSQFLKSIKSILLTSFVILLSLTVCAQDVENPDYSEFRKGNFFYISPNGGEVSFKRTRRRQVERYEDEDQKFIFSIVWSSDSTYLLTLIKSRGVHRSKKKEIIGKQLFCKITSVYLDQYEVLISENKRYEDVSKIIIYKD